mmetsp:Transcript_33731/g.81792  ORF Transcript_33731/g.81792 Transcript_33731/m.81792 type:complete len:396 (+) Transcript_33731:71-1258(+)
MARGDSLRTLAAYNNAKKNFRRGGNGGILQEPKKIFAMFVLLVILCITESMRSTVAVLYNHHNQGESEAEMQPIIREQQCPVGIFNNDTKHMDVNPACHLDSQKLLSMERVPTTKKITFMLIYYNDHHHLAHQLQSWKNFSQTALDQMQFLIVDDGSAPGHTAKEFLQANYEYAESVDIVIYSIEQDLLWNIGGARNLGFWMANTEWIFMSDGDIHVSRETMDYVVDLTTKPVENFPGNETDPATEYLMNVFVMFQRYRPSGFKPHPAVMLLPKASYWYVGGCDEDFVGSYGYTDPHFRYKVEVDPTLHLINAYPDMDEHKVPPLVEMADDNSCPKGIQCLGAFSGFKAPREVTRNQKMFFSKRGKGAWSHKVFRYTWHYVPWKKSPSWWSWIFS